jgi:hypothetical protein
VHSNQNLDAIGYRESVENSESCSEEWIRGIESCDSLLEPQ